MRLERLVAGIGSVDRAGSDVEIAGLAYDSRAVRPGTLFFCVPGFRSDGHDFAARALADGAVALVVERPLGLGAPEVLVPSVRARDGSHRQSLRRTIRAPRCALWVSRARTARRRLRSWCARCWRRLACRRVCWAPSRRLSAAKSSRAIEDRRASRSAGARPPRRSTCRRACARCSTVGMARARWRSPRTRSSWGARAGFALPRRCSRT